MKSDTPHPAEIIDGQLRVRLRSGESRILLTSPSPATDNATVEKRMPIGFDNGTSLALTSGWHLSFPTSTPAVTESFTLDSLQTWEHLIPQTAELMGTGIYECTFRVNEDEWTQRPCQLDLGDVRESARVSLNGVDLGCAWAVPFVVDVPQGLLHKGDNHLHIEVTNLPANRISALDRQGIPWRKFEDINVVDINYRPTSYAHWTPMPSGLQGPVRLIRQ